MQTNVNLNAPSTGFGDTIAKISVWTGVDDLYTASKAFMAVVRKKKLDPEQCSSCEANRQLLNQIFPYKTKRKVRFLRDYQKPAIVTIDGVQSTIIEFTAKAGEVFEIDKSHPIFNLLLSLTDYRILEEVK